MALFDQISKDIFAAMKAQDKVRLRQERRLDCLSRRHRPAGPQAALVPDSRLLLIVRPAERLRKRCKNRGL